MAKPLTAKAIAALKPGRRFNDRTIEARSEVPVGKPDGLYCVVGADGPRSWALRYRRPRNGKPAKLTLGSVYLGDDAPAPTLGGPLTLAGARKLALGAQVVVDLGRDPGREKQDAAAERGERMKDTFGDVLDRYYAEAVPRKKRQRSAATARRLIEKDCKDWLDLPVRSIARRDVRLLLSRIAKRGRGSMADNIRARLSPVFKWAVENELADENPVAQVKKLGEAVERARVFDDDELAEVWRAAETLGAPWSNLAKMLTLTGQRIGEAEAMTFADLRDLDGDAPTWRIPAEVAKNGVEHHVPLSPPAVAVLKDQIEARRKLVEKIEDAARRKLVERVPFVFWGGRIGRKGDVTKLSGRSRFRGRWRDAVNEARVEAGRDPMPDWRPHDARRTCVSGLARLGVPIHVAEIVVNHRPAQSLKGVARVYNRYDYAAEQRHALAVWGAHVEALVEGKKDAGNVVALRS